MDFQELTESVKATLYDRASKPFTGTFALSWLIFNWKIIASLFWVDEKLLNGVTRIGYIEENFINKCDNLIYPFFFTILLLIIIPFLNLGGLWLKVFFKNIEFNKITKVSPIDARKYAELLNKLKSQDTELNDKISSLNETIDSLKLTLDKSNKNYSTLENKYSESEEKLNTSNKELKMIKVKNDKILVEKNKLLGFVKELLAISELYKNTYGKLRKNDYEIKKIVETFNYKNIFENDLKTLENQINSYLH